MKLTQSSDQLVLTDTPATSSWFVSLGGCVLGGVLLVIGLFLQAGLGQQLILILVGFGVMTVSLIKLHRDYEMISTFSPQQVEIKHKRFGSDARLVASYPLAEIEEVVMDWDIIDEGGAKFFYTFLRLRSGKSIPLLVRFSKSQLETGEVTNTIRDFLIRHQKAE